MVTYVESCQGAATYVPGRVLLSPPTKHQVRAGVQGVGLGTLFRVGVLFHVLGTTGSMFVRTYRTRCVLVPQKRGPTLLGWCPGHFGSKKVGRKKII